MAYKSHLSQFKENTIDTANIDNDILEYLLLTEDTSEEDQAFGELMYLLDQCDTELNQLIKIKEQLNKEGKLSEDVSEIVNTLPILQDLGITFVGTESYSDIEILDKKLEVGIEGLLDSIKKAVKTVAEKFFKTIDTTITNATASEKTIEKQDKANKEIVKKIEQTPNPSENITFKGYSKDDFAKMFLFKLNYSLFLNKYISTVEEFIRDYWNKTTKVIDDFSLAGGDPSGRNNDAIRETKTSDSLKKDKYGQYEKDYLNDKIIDAFQEASDKTKYGVRKQKLEEYRKSIKDIKTQFQEITLSPSDASQYKQSIAENLGTKITKNNEEFVNTLKSFNARIVEYKKNAQARYKSEQQWFEDMFTVKELKDFEKKGIQSRAYVERDIKKHIRDALTDVRNRVREFIKISALTSKSVRNFYNALPKS